MKEEIKVIIKRPNDPVGTTESIKEVMTAEEFEQAKKGLGSIWPSDWAAVTEEEFTDICREIARECEAEGYPSHGENYELRVEEAKKRYFGEDY